MRNFFKNLFAYVKKNGTLFIILLINFVAMIKSKPQYMDLFQLVIFGYTYLFSAAFISWVHFTKGYFYEMGVIYAIKKKTLEKVNKQSNNIYLMLKHIYERIMAETPSFFKKLRAFGISLTALGTSIIGIPALIPSNAAIKFPEIVTYYGGQCIWIGAVIAAISQLTVKDTNDLTQK